MAPLKSWTEALKSHFMEPTREFIDQLYRERVQDARAQSVGDRLLAGIELFAMVCEFSRAGIRMQHPGVDEEQVERLLAERLAIARKLENAA